MAGFRGSTILTLALAGLTAGAPALSAHALPGVVAASQAPSSSAGPPPSAPAPSSGGAVPQASMPVQAPVLSDAQLDRVRRALSQEHGLNLDDQQLRFYLEIVGKQPTFAEYAKGYDFVNGPTKRGDPMSHKEFLALVTPKEMNSSAGITAMETLQFAVTNALGQTLIRKALDDLKNARNEREVEEIRQRINRELAALRGDN
jgi:hypothetical protein